MKIYHSDCLNVLKKIPTNSIDSIVTDPPYGISYLGKKWDKALPSKEIWRECFRVLRPGGYILAFASGKLYHRLAIVMEEVGFETQNMLAWIYGNGFPKGMNLSFQFDLAKTLSRPDDKFRAYLREAINRSSYTITKLEDKCGTNGVFSHYLGKSQPSFPSHRVWKILKRTLKLDRTYDDFFNKREQLRRQLKGKNRGLPLGEHFHSLTRDFEEYRPKTALAKKWKGWRYGKMSLRPCLEPIYFGQKPPLRPITENIKAHGVGALNIEGRRVRGRDGKLKNPSSVMHDGSDEVLKWLNGESPRASLSLNEFPFEGEDWPFFYVPKPMGEERRKNPHPTLKPIRLMRQLVALVTPPKGVCLDPFMGSGTTGAACLAGGLGFIGIERERKYYKMAKNRLKKINHKEAA